LSEEEQLGGHTIAQHVGKSQDYLLSLINDEEMTAQRQSILISRATTHPAPRRQGIDMSIEIYVLSDTQLNSIAEWQDAIDAEEFPLHLANDVPLDGRGGSLVAHLRDGATCIEYRVEDFDRLKECYKKINFGRDWKYLLAIPWIHGFDGLTAAWMAATAYARATSGVVFDPQESKLFDPAEACKVIEEMERTRPEAEKTLRNHVEQLSAKSPETRAALQAFMQRRSTKSSQT
jgi:hypothetical protein